MLKYLLNEEQKYKANNRIKELKKSKEKWKKELESANSYLEKCPTKFYQATKERIKYAQDKIDKIDKNIKDFKEALEKGYIYI